jgi:hypothetical protein
MHKSATKCNKTIGKWCKNKHGASKIIDTFETYHAYTNKEDLMLCDAWLHIGTDPISGAEQKGGHFWRRIYLYFHEHRKFKPDNFESDRNEASLSKRWSFIQLECNRFCGALENMKNRKQSGHGVNELVRCFLLV